MIRHSWLWTALAVMALLAGCGQQRAPERLGMIHTIGYDRSDGGKLTVSLYVPIFESAQGATESKLLTATAQAGKEAQLAASIRTHRELAGGRLRHALFGETLARQGIGRQLDSLMRDPAISPRVIISVAEGSAAGLLDRRHSRHPGVGMDIDRMLEKEIRAGFGPRLSLFAFERDLLDEGIDPIAPVLDAGDDDLKTSGLGLFQDDRYVGKIESSDMPIFSLLDGKPPGLDLHLKLDEEGPEVEGKKRQTFLIAGSVRSSRQIRVSRDAGGQFEVSIRIRAEGPVLEYTGEQRLDVPASRRQVEAQIGEAIARRASALISQMQEYGADGLGLGMHVRNSLSWREWKELDWRETFPKVKLNCRAAFTITNYGRFQ